MLRAIREIKPAWVVGENVRGLVSWNGGMVFDEVQADLEAEGYEVLPFLLPACAVNAPHRRERAWFVAYSNSNGFQRSQKFEKEYDRRFQKGVEEGYELNSLHGNGLIADSYRQRLQSNSLGELGGVQSKETAFQRGEFSRTHSTPAGWERFPTQPPVRERNDGIPEKLDGITFSKWRNESIKAYGNAIVPQVALQIFKSIEQYTLLNP